MDRFEVNVSGFKSSTCVHNTVMFFGLFVLFCFVLFVCLFVFCMDYEISYR